MICATHLKPLVLRDFLTEFYSDPDHLVSVVLHVAVCMCVYMYKYFFEEAKCSVYINITSSFATTNWILT